MDCVANSVSPLREPIVLEVHSVPQRKRSEVWSDHETRALISVWTDYLADLRRTKRNRKVYNRIVTALSNRYEIHRSSNEVKHKIANLSRDYRREKKKMKSGLPHTTWKFYDLVHDLLSGPPKNKEFIVIEKVESLSPEDCQVEAVSLTGTVLNEPVSITQPSSPTFASTSTEGESSRPSLPRLLAEVTTTDICTTVPISATIANNISLSEVSTTCNTATNTTPCSSFPPWLEKLMEMQLEFTKKSQELEEKRLQLMADNVELQRQSMHLQHQFLKIFEELNKSYRC